MSEPVYTSETPATDAPETPAPLDQGATPQQSPSDPAATNGSEHLGDPGKRALDRMKAERDDAQRRLREFEDRDLSELQRAQRDREELQQQLATVRQEATRNRVALTKGLPPEIASVLSGSNEDELAAHADALLAWRGGATPPAPRPDPGQGPRPTTPEAEEEAEYKRFFPNG